MRPIGRISTAGSQPDRLAVALLLPAGALAGHAAGYALAGSQGHAEPSHGYLPVVSAAALPLALAALAWFAYGGATRRRRPSLRPLLLGQPLLFLLQEVAEHLVSGHGLASLAHSPAVRAGMLAQVVIAGIGLLLVWAARATGRAAAASLVRRRGGWCVRPPALRPPAVRAARSRPRCTLASERGPPSLSFLA